MSERTRWLLTKRLVCWLIGHRWDKRGDLLVRCDRCRLFEMAHP